MEKIMRVPFDIKSLDLDFKREVSLSVLCRYLQEAAEQHVTMMGVDMDTMMEKNMTWMMLKFRIHVNHYPKGSRRIILETWPSEKKGTYITRECRYYLENESEPFAVAAQWWVLIDMERERMVRIPEDLVSPDWFTDEKVFDTPFPRLKPEPGDIKDKHFDIRLSDIDLNRHVNNLRYIEWINESVPNDKWNDSEIEELSIEFRNQAAYGDGVISQYYPVSDSGNDSNGYFHLLKKDSSDSEVVRALTTRRAFKQSGQARLTA